MSKVDVSVIKYLGKVRNGILTLINITLDSKVFDATFFYTDKDMILTITETVEKEIGPIKDLPEYEEILRNCLRRVVPYTQMFDNIDPLDVKPYLKALFPNAKL